MQLGWIDYSKDERNKIVLILRLLGTQTALDELGIGTVRDGFSDLLFPGISTLQTRAKYFVLIPYLFHLAETQHFAKTSDVGLWLGKQEEMLVKTLVENSDASTEGIIGSRTYKQGRTVKLKPSSIYWNGLRTIGILRQPELSIDNACEITYLYSRKRKEISLKAEGDIEAADDKDVLNDGLVLFRPIIPDPDLLRHEAIDLNNKEAVYLFERFTQGDATQHSLLAHMIKNGLMFDSFADIDANALPDRLATIVRLAQNFADFIYGAHLLYNVIYSEGKDPAIQNEFKQWLTDEYRSLDLHTIITMTKCSSSDGVGAFLLEFNRHIQNGDIEAAKQLLINRERFIKKDRAKLCKPEQYRYERPVHHYRLSYRFGTAKDIIQDIFKGLERHYGKNNISPGK